MIVVKLDRSAPSSLSWLCVCLAIVPALSGARCNISVCQPRSKMFLRILLAFLLFEASFGQFFTNGRYGKRSQGVLVDEGSSMDLGALSAADAANPRLACVYTGYQDLFRCQRLPTDSSGRINTMAAK